jgi:hypothetical protein
MTRRCPAAATTAGRPGRAGQAPSPPLLARLGRAAPLALCALVHLGTPLAPRGAGLAAQDVRSAVLPDTIRVGDVFTVALRLELPAGVAAILPDTLPVSGDLENAGGRDERVVEGPGGVRTVTAAYRLTAWRPGTLPLPPLPVLLRAPDGERVVEAQLPAVRVLSVLPADTAGIEPRPARDVLGGSRLLWPWLLLGLALVLAGIGAWLLYRRFRRPAAAVQAPAVPPRERALAELDAARTAGHLERGEVKAFYSLVTEALRRYLGSLRPGWGADLTSGELLHRLRGDLPEDPRTLARVLFAADLVKFARHRPGADEALADWEAARGWVAGFQPPEPSPPPAPDAAPDAATDAAAEAAPDAAPDDAPDASPYAPPAGRRGPGAADPAARAAAGEGEPR